MSIQFAAPDPLEAEIARIVEGLRNGLSAAELESQRVDLKEEAGRRCRSGEIMDPLPENERAAEQMAREVACMANTPSDCALILGVADDGTLIGTGLDPEWLRGRIYDLLQRALTATVREVVVNGKRLLVVTMPQAVEPIKFRSKIQWRVGKRCVEIDAASWHQRMYQLRGDWSGEASPVPPNQSQPTALQRAREYLRASNEPRSIELAGASDLDLLRRLNAIHAGGNFNNAGALLFAARAQPALDYIRREHPGGDSVIRLRQRGLSVLEELHEVEVAFRAANPTAHLADRQQLVVGKINELPFLAVREAIVNGLSHRDWQSPEPTSVEHVGAVLTVASPGGFPTGITPENIITHPSKPRNRTLTAMLSRLRVAEQEGIGVDRMISSMIRLGYPEPHISEVSGPLVRVVLIGGRPDREWLSLLSQVIPDQHASNLDSLILLRSAVFSGWIDAQKGSHLIQKTHPEAEYALNHLASAHLSSGQPLIVPVKGIPVGSPTAWRPSAATRQVMATETTRVTSADGRSTLATQWAQSRGRVSTTELSDIGATYPNVAGAVLKGLQEDGVLEPASASGGGRGFHYLPVATRMARHRDPSQRQPGS